jgi:hypothetical protein
MAHKRGLHWMEITVYFQAFDGSDLVARMHHRERQAAVDALSIDDHGAGACRGGDFSEPPEPRS